MDLLQAMQSRHAVRAYTSAPIEGEALSRLRAAVDECNLESGLNIQLCTGEAGAFSGRMARYGNFKNANNYLALVGKKGPGLEEKCGYYGQKIVLLAQQLGLNSCWVAMSYSKAKTAAVIRPGEKQVIVVSLGYGQSPGAPHKSKPFDAFYTAAGSLPDWFRRGVEAAMLAPTALNQQKFRFELAGDTVRALPGAGFYTKLDLGIAKYHFELGAGDAGWRWA